MSQQFANRSTAQIFSMVVGIVFILTSAPCVVAMIHDIITQADNMVGAITAGTFFLILGVIGILMTRWGYKRTEKSFELDANLERRLLNFAREHEGRVTVGLLASESPLTLADCQAALESMERRGVCRSEFETTGALVYVFPDFVATESRDVFDFDVAEEPASAHVEAQSSNSGDWN